MAAPGGPASPLLDAKQPLNVELLDATIKAFYGAGSNQEVCKLLTSQPDRLRLTAISRRNTQQFLAAIIQSS